MKMSKLWIALLLCVLTLESVGQDSTGRSDIYKFGDGVLFVYSRPLHWKGRDFLKLGAVLAGTAAISLLDEPVEDLMDLRENKFLHGIERVGFHYGKPYSAFAFTGGFYLYGLITNNRWAKDTGLLLGATLLTSGLLQTLSKDAIGRARPDTGYDPYTFKPFKQDAGFHALPSGHFAVALGISHILSKRIDSLPVKIVAYTLAGTTLFSRLYTESHWISDKALGGALAWYCANTVMKRFQSRNYIRTEQKKVSWNFVPLPGGIRVFAKF